MESVDLVRAYESSRESYESFAQTVSNLISRLLGADSVAMHSVSHRCKSLNSLKVKIEKKNGYETLEQITDLAGVRLIAHYEDDVDKIAKIVESEFLVDTENSIDKRKALDPDRFGYLSLHYVVSLKPERTDLKEYQAFAGLKAEIQIRSILQHTWAEIEHDTGYKSNVEVPKHIRRRFSRLAGLLELADQEFIGIRTALEEYSVEVAAQIAVVPDEKSDSLDVLIDKVSLGKFYELDPLVVEIDKEICEVLNATSMSDVSFALKDVGRFEVVGIHSLAELKAALKSNRDLIIERARYIANNSGGKGGKDSEPLRLRYAVCTLYLLQVLAAKSGELDAVCEKLDLMGMKGGTRLAKSLKEILDNAAV